MEPHEIRLDRIDTALECLEPQQAISFEALLLASHLFEKIGRDAKGHIASLAALRPGPEGLGTWFCLISRANRAQAVLTVKADPRDPTQRMILERYTVATQAISAASMRSLRETVTGQAGQAR